MSAFGLVIARIAAVVPLTVLALALAFMVAVGVVWPSVERQAMVDKLAEAMKNVGAVIAGPPARCGTANSRPAGAPRTAKIPAEAKIPGTDGSEDSGH